MARVLIVLVSVALGGALGLFINRLSIRPLFQGVAAMLVSWFLGSITTTVLWFTFAFDPDGVAAGGVSFGLSESLITSLLVVVVGGIVYLVLGWLGSAMLPALVTRRTMVMGLLGGLAGSLIAICHLPFGRSL